MKNILVPTDFSDAAKNAATYALHFAKQVKAGKIVLYNAYQQPVIVDADITPTPLEMIDFNELKDISNIGLERFKAQLAQNITDGIIIETVGDYNTLDLGLEDICKTYAIDAIVMGVTGGGSFDEAVMGSTAVDVARKSVIPVIIVPPGVTFTPLETVLLACDFKKVVETTPVEPIKQILDETKAKLFVLNIDHNNRNFSAETPFESLMLDTLLHGYNPEYQFVDSTDFVHAINNFAEEKSVDLIITIPKKHGFFEGLFKRSHTKQLAFHSHVPLMVIHE